MNDLQFIFMLTRDDRTVAHAAQCIDVAIGAGIERIGFKDIGLPLPKLSGLMLKLREAGVRTYLEVVSLDREAELKSVQAAIDLGVDCLLGGTCVEETSRLLEGTATEYYPFAGSIAGHPTRLHGAIADIVGSAVAIASHPFVSGIDLLAYRSFVAAPALMKAVCEAVDKPVIMAGSIDRPEQIAAVRQSGAAGFTVGTSALEGRFPAASQSLDAQLWSILDHARR